MSSWIASPIVGRRASSRCSLAPALAFTAAALSGAAPRSGKTTPSTPAASADAQERSEVRRVLEVLEDEDERVVAGRPRRWRAISSSVGPAALPHLEQDALVPVEAGDAAEPVGGHAVDRQVDAAGRVGDRAQLRRRLGAWPR